MRETGVLDEREHNQDEFDAVQQALRQELAAFEADIHDAFRSNQKTREAHLTKSALLGMVINGESDEEIDRFFAKKKLRQQISLEKRLVEAVGLIPRVHTVAEMVRQGLDSDSKLRFEEDDYRALDTTLGKILTRGELTPQVQGSMRLLFGFATVDDPRVNLNVILLMKANAAGIVRHKLEASKHDFADSLRAQEGARLLYRLVTRTRTGYPTVQSMAESIAYDTEARTKAVYTDDIERNQRMIETYVSDAFDIMYPTGPSHP